MSEHATGIVRECDCPEYVSRCAHDGKWRVWMVTRSDSRREFTRRTGLEPVPGVRCPGCGHAIVLVEGESWVVAGPGVMAEPHCLCAIGLTISLRSDVKSDRRGVVRDTPPQFYKTTAEEAEAAFEQCVAAMHDAAEREWPAVRRGASASAAGHVARADGQGGRDG